jgi:hypothetical protein
VSWPGAIENIELRVVTMTMTIEEIRRALADGPTRELIRQAELELRLEELARAEENYVRRVYFEEGVALGRVEMLLEQIAVRYGEPEPTAETERTVREATDRQVRDWNLRILDAATVAELLADPSGPWRGES